MSESIEAEKAKSEKLRAFRDEIRRVAEEETKASNAHFKMPEGEAFRFEDLNEEDMRIWEEVRNGSVTRESLEAYFQTIYTPSRRLRDETTSSRYAFMQFIANKASAIFTERAVQKMDGKIGKKK